MDFMFGVPDIEVHRAVLRAIRDSGLRGFMGRAVRDLNPDSGWRDPWFIPLDEVFAQLSQLAREFPSGLPVSSVLPAPGTVRTMTVDGLLQVKEWARAEGSQITIHMGEYDEERVTAIDRWGIGAFHKGEEIGFLGPDVVAAHCVKLDEAELEIVARTGTQVSYNPVSNAYLGAGIAPIPRMLELGIDVSLATDGGACANTEDMLEAMKFGLLIQKGGAQDARIMNARDILRLATVGGAKALGLPADLGALEVGRLADFFLFDPMRLKSVPMHEPIGSLVYTGEQSNVDTVVIDGKVVLEGGKFPNIDEEAFVQEVHERALALSKRVGTFRLMKGRRFTPCALRRRMGQDGAGRGRAEHDASDNGAARARTGAPAARPRSTTEPRRAVIYDNCTIFTMDAERRILTGAAVAVDGTTIAAVGKSADVRAARPGRRRARPARLARRARAWSTGTSTCRRRCCAASPTTCRCGSGWRSGSSSSRATTPPPTCRPRPASRWSR